MKIVIAPQGFKGSLTALEVARAIGDGVRQVEPDAEIDMVPVADGGDGTLQALVDVSGGRVVTTLGAGPLGAPVDAEWGSMGDGETAVIEMARASGLQNRAKSRGTEKGKSRDATAPVGRASNRQDNWDLLTGRQDSSTNSWPSNRPWATQVLLSDLAPLKSTPRISTRPPGHG